MSIVTYKSPNSICDICGETASAEDIYAIAHCREDHAAKVHLSCAFPDYATLQALHEELVDALHRAVTEMKFWAKGHADAEIFIAEKALANAAKLAPTKTVAEDKISVPKDLLERICGMVYATRGEQHRLDYVTDHEYAQLVTLRHSGHDSIETVLTALSGK